MNPEKQKLELTWIKKANRPRLQPLLRLLPAGEDESPSTPTAHAQEAILRVCHGPRCDCVSILIAFQPPIPPGDFWLDPDQKSLNRSGDQNDDGKGDAGLARRDSLE
ncbi:MAG: hypothetical protein KGS61_11080 [Verrucomicrobia bacterium]|nr:hypothetical protein [Verrucomicrobiota bacterium]